jgi:hypothetical protein
MPKPRRIVSTKQLDDAVAALIADSLREEKREALKAQATAKKLTARKNKK